mmetsp:Transcript_46175/g.53464  ORF Transcript_46175/g.53464 Transcript_46175/m.53464 type:complete len:188 (+) Transcript_46175:36-599(+)
MKTAFILVAILCATYVLSQETVTIESCQDSQCTTGCTTQSFTAGECLEEEGTNNTVQLNCNAGVTMCNDLKIYQDAACSDASEMALFNNACNSCQMNFTVSCGALHDAVFLAVNCTDSACQNCGGAKIVPFNKCTYVAPLGYALLTTVSACTAVQMTTFEGESCSATNFSQKFPSGLCLDGNIFRCN